MLRRTRVRTPVRPPTSSRSLIRVVLVTRLLWCGTVPAPEVPDARVAATKGHDELAPRITSRRTTTLASGPEARLVVPPPAAAFGNDVPPAPTRARVVVIDRRATFAVTEAGLERFRERVAPHPDGVPVLVIGSADTGYTLENLDGYLPDAGPLLFALSSTRGGSFGRRLAERRGPHATSLDVRGADLAIPLLRRRFVHDGLPRPA
jgi:hypothetical protein